VLGWNHTCEKDVGAGKKVKDYGKWKIHITKEGGFQM
jgi:hypothetical protein